VIKISYFYTRYFDNITYYSHRRSNALSTIFGAIIYSLSGPRYILNIKSLSSERLRLELYLKGNSF
jgi:hypothetical protein